jgi:hypothetical protein
MGIERKISSDTKKKLDATRIRCAVSRRFGKVAPNKNSALNNATGGHSSTKKANRSTAYPSIPADEKTASPPPYN